MLLNLTDLQKLEVVPSEQFLFADLSQRVWISEKSWNSHNYRTKWGEISIYS